MKLFRSSKPKTKKSKRVPPKLSVPAPRERGGRTRRNSKKARSARRRSPAARVAMWSMTFVMWGFVGLIGIAGYMVYALPGQDIFTIPKRTEGIVLLADNGEVLAESGMFLGDDVRLRDLPSYVPQAVLAIEDRRFRQHFGVDLVALARAMYRNFKAGRVVQGGSTLTQQLAKNLFLKPERTIHRKVQEAILALWLEHKFSKDEILQLYLNRVYFGGGAYGVEAAAKTYFDKSARQLSLAEAAAMAALLKAPSRLNPKSNPKGSRKRSILVLSSMIKEGFITEAEAKRAVNRPADVKAIDYIPATQYIVDWVEELVPEYTGSKADGLIVQTSINPALQTVAERSLRRRLVNQGAKLNVSQGAMVVMNPTGEIVAMVGGKSYIKSQFNRAVSAKRQPGSAFKPFVYLSAVDMGFSPNSIVEDERFCIDRWCPENYNKKYYGQVTLKSALARSINTVAVRLAVEAGPALVVSNAKRLGIKSKLESLPSIALGTSEVSLLELVGAYAPFANGGRGVFPNVIKRIVSTDGRILYERKGTGPGQVLDPTELGTMNNMLSAVVSGGTGKRARLEGREVGGKTGTTQSYKDAWFIGYTAQYVAGVWVGNDDSKPTKRVTGGSLPAQIWKDVMVAAHANLPAVPLPGEPLSSDTDYLGDSWPIDDFFESAGRAEETITTFFRDIFGNQRGEQGGFDQPRVRTQRRNNGVQDDNR